MDSPRYRYALLLAVVVFGGLLRFGAVGWGLPRHDLGQDEMITALRVRDGVLVGHKDWPRFHWPNLNVHVSRAGVAVVRWAEEKLGHEERDDVLIGRVLTAVAGTLTLVVLYLVGARLFDPLVGVAAAGFLALVPLHAFRSRLWVPDVPMTFFYTLALLAAAWVLSKPTYLRFVAGGVAVGLATATKYNGAGACLPLLVAAVLAVAAMRGRWRWAAIAARLALAAAISVAVFFAVDPFALARFDEVLGGMGYITGKYIDAPASGFLGWHIWTYVATAFFGDRFEGVGQVISLAALAGWAVLLARRDRPGILAWLPCLLYLLAFSSILHDPFERMFLPVVPHMALLAAVALVGGARWVASRRARPRLARTLAVGGTVAVLVLAALPVTRQVVGARSGDTRIEAAAWLDANVPSGAFVFREWDMIFPRGRRFDFNRRLYDLWQGRWTPRLVSKYMDFVVTTSTNYERVRRQRVRPIYARKAGFYDELLDGPLFELVARFEPDWRAFGPEVRVYRCLWPRGVVLGPARTERDLVRQIPWFSNSRLRQEFHAQGSVRLRAGNLVAGKATVRPAGWYRLEVTARSSTDAPLEAGLGRATRTFRIAGEQTVTVRAFLRPGKNWWWLRAGADLAEGGDLTLDAVRLVRPSPVELGAAADAGESTPPPVPKNQEGETE